MKSVECSVQCHGRWDLAWLYTNLPEPRGRSFDRGLAHPVEFATNVAYLKELRSVEEAMRGGGQQSGAGRATEDEDGEAEGHGGAGRGKKKKGKGGGKGEEEAGAKGARGNNQ